MNLWRDVTDFSDLADPVPCVLCGKSASPTVVGNHFKCSEDGHLFNKDGSPLPEGVECYCDKCRDAKKEQDLLAKLEEEVQEQPKRKGKGKKKKK